MTNTTIIQPFKIMTLILIITALAACSGHGRSGHHMDTMFNVIAYKLDFTDQQEAMLEDIRLQIKTIKEESKEQKKAQYSEIVELFEAERLDTERIESVLENHQDYIKAQIPKLLPSLEKLHASLSVQQKQKVVEFMSKRLDHD